jgi:hypothetical protein
MELVMGLDAELEMETQFMGKLFGVSQKNLDSFSCLS